MKTFGIILKVVEIYGSKTEEVQNYTAGTWFEYLYPDGTERKVKKLLLPSFKIAEVMQESGIYYHLDGIDKWYVNKWKDIKCVS